MTVSQEVYFGVTDPGPGGAVAIILVLMMAVPLVVLFRLAAPRPLTSRRRWRSSTSGTRSGPRPVRAVRLRISRLKLLPGGGRIAAQIAARRRLSAKAFSIAGLLLGALFILLPIFWIVETAFQTPLDAFQMPPHFIFSPTLANFRALYSGPDAQAVPYLSDIGHSLVVLLSSMAI